MAGSGPVDASWAVDRHHGARYAITKTYGVVMHQEGDKGKQVLIRSYRDGIRIGCTFVSNDALREIWEMHSGFLNSQESVTHQAGY
jgi:hypothetical protein